MRSTQKQMAPLKKFPDFKNNDQVHRRILPLSQTMLTPLGTYLAPHLFDAFDETDNNNKKQCTQTMNKKSNKDGKKLI